MSVLAATSWTDGLADDPAKTAAYLCLLAGLAAGAGLALRALNQRTRALRAQVLAVTLASLAVGAVAALVLAELMVLEPGEARTVVGVLVVTAAFATGLVLLASGPLRRDVRRLEHVVRRVEEGDRATRTGLRRSDELGHVARALDDLVTRLDTLERERAGYDDERNALLSSIGHDLRTPLAALRAAIEAMADGVAPDPQRYLRSMQHDVEALSSLVDDLFLLSRLESGRLELPRTTVDLGELAEEAVESLAPAAAGAGIDLVLDVSGAVVVTANPTALGRVLRNLIDNALRHAPAGSRVAVTVSADARPTVRVVDEGPGFPAGFSAVAFEHFTRADASRTRTTGGAGLGLAIARGLVEAHGGRIWIEDAPGGRVAFDVPAA